MQRRESAVRNPSWRMVGAQAQHFRKRARLTQEGLCELVGVQVDTIASMEQGRRALQPELAATLDEVLGAGGALAVAIGHMPLRERFPVFARDFVDLEQAALTLLSYENQVVPGLLQTERYAEAVFGCLFPPISAEESAERLSGRLERQRIFGREPWPPMMCFLVEEVVLHRPIGGRDVLLGQLNHLRQCAELPFLGLQIVPTSREKHASLDGPMVLIETPDHNQLAYVEGQRVSFLIEDPDEVSVLQQKYGMLRSQALTPEESMGLLDDLAGAA
ncbi:helix-turn-helix domain-containing protein [Streptomyces sp. NPDC060194]|uniref:helix-turn-helix domain-containing protein n=1 Tax=Streptomyces sp. NPDC060194 TaxID=3347069 RepID=UPI00365FA12C